MNLVMLLLARCEPIVSPKIKKILLRISSKNPQLYSYVINSHWKLRIQPKQWAARQGTLALVVKGRPNKLEIEGATCRWPSLPTWRQVSRGFTKFTQLHVVTSQFVMFISCALRARMEDRTGSRLDSCEVNIYLQLAIGLQVVVLYLL